MAGRYASICIVVKNGVDMGQRRRRVREKNQTTMRDETPPESCPNPDSELPATIQAGAVGAALPAEEIKGPERMTSAQGKIDAVANLTMKAYERAGTLELSREESDALQEQFQDQDFRTGAAGKENLIYIEHAALRDRLNKVLGLGQWSLIVRNRWAEEFQFYSKTDRSYKKGTRVYCEAMLVVRGCFVAEAVGSMNYFPNEATDFSDAAEGAKTAAFRRCAKEFGIGLQAWNREWCDGWWQRRTQGRRTAAPQQAPPPAARPAAPPAAPKPPPQAPPESPERKKARWITLLRQAAGDRDEYAIEFLVEQGILLPNETLEDYPIDKIPQTKPIAQGMLDEIKARSGAGNPPPKQAAPAEPPPPPAEEWRTFPMPFGKQAGVALGNLDRKYLFGLWCNYTVEREYKGRPRPAEKIAADEKLRAMLDQAGAHYQFTMPTARPAPSRAEEVAAPPGVQERSEEWPEDDDVPF